MSAFDDAKKAFEEQNYKKALELYSQCFGESDTDKSRCTLLFNIGVCNFRTYKNDRNDKYIYDSINAYKSAIKYSKGVSNDSINGIYYNLGLCYSLIDMKKEAYICIKYALSKKPDDEMTINLINRLEKELFKDILKQAK